MNEIRDAVGNFLYGIINKALNDTWIFWIGLGAIALSALQVLLAKKYPGLGTRVAGLIMCLISAIAFLISYAPLFRGQ